MHVEIENLIEMSLADGVVTEKERAIIIRKGETLGEDKDEIEMILDAKIALMEKEQNKIQRATSSNSNKVGKIKKCPSCGASVSSFANKCNDCDHEFRYDALQNLTSNVRESGNKVSDISNTPIPINKEAIIEFLAFSISNVKNGGLSYEERSAWGAKLDEAYNKANVIFSEEELKSIQKQYKNAIYEAKGDLEHESPAHKKALEEHSAWIKSPAWIIMMVITMAMGFGVYYLIYLAFFS